MRPLEIGVCAWSLDRHDIYGVFDTIRSKLQLGVAQLGFFGRSVVESADADRVAAAATAARVEISATFVAFDGQDYSSIAAITRTGGFVPDDVWPDRLDLTKRAAHLTAALGVGLMGLHVGTIPTERPSSAFDALVSRTQAAADIMREHGVTGLIETGPDSAETLLAFLNAAGRDNLKISLDPGNLVTYGAGDPVQAVTRLRPPAAEVAHVHVKDAVAARRAGVEWGSEVFPGSGEADIPRVISKLRAGGYRGPLLIERKTGGGMGDIPECVDYLRSLIG